MGDKSAGKHQPACPILRVVATHQLLSSETKIWLEIPNVCQKKVETGSNLHENPESASGAARITIAELLIHSREARTAAAPSQHRYSHKSVRSSDFNFGTAAVFGSELLA